MCIRDRACSSPRQSIYPRVRPRHLFLPSLREGKHQSRDRQGPAPGACDKGKRGLRLSYCEHYDTEIRDGSPPLPTGILMAQRLSLIHIYWTLPHRTKKYLFLSRPLTCPKRKYCHTSPRASNTKPCHIGSVSYTHLHHRAKLR